MSLYGSVIPSDAQGGFSFRNKVINGQFDVWQRGTSFSVSNSVNLYNADRFMTEGYGHTYTASRQTFTAGQTDVPGYPTYYLRLASTTTVSAGQYFALVQRIETPQVTTGYGTYTLSFWVRASSSTLSAGAFTYGIDGANQTSPALTTTWQKITTTGTTTSTGNYLTMYLINFGVGKGNISVDIANVQFEYGSIATPFEKRPYPVELSMCQRYYHFLGGDTAYQSINTCVYYSSSEAVGFFRNPVEMRAIPTISKSGDWTVLGGAGTVGQNVSADQLGPKTIQFGFYSGGSGQTGQATLLRVSNNINFRLTFEAEL